MTGRLEFSSYWFAGQDEYCLRIGRDHDTQILLIPPLFDEMNRMRRMIVDTMRALNEAGIGSILPDLPGTNESLLQQEEANLDIWRDALKACLSDHSTCAFIASFRGACLIDGLSDSLPHWRFAPVKGNSLLRTLMRTRIASDKEAGVVTKTVDLTESVTSKPIMLAGNNIGKKMFEQLQKATPETLPNLRTARLASDSQPADAMLTGTPLWLRAEPDADQVLSQSIANDLAKWVRI